MDISQDLDEAEKGSATGKNVELIDDDDDEGPALPGHTADFPKIKAKKLPAVRVRGDTPGITAGDDSVHEPVFKPGQNNKATLAE